MRARPTRVRLRSSCRNISLTLTLFHLLRLSITFCFFLLPSLCRTFYLHAFLYTLYAPLSLSLAFSVFYNLSFFFSLLVRVHTNGGTRPLGRVCLNTRYTRTSAFSHALFTFKLHKNSESLRIVMLLSCVFYFVLCMCFVHTYARGTICRQCSLFVFLLLSSYSFPTYLGPPLLAARKFCYGSSGVLLWRLCCVY